MIYQEELYRQRRWQIREHLDDEAARLLGEEVAIAVHLLVRHEEDEVAER